MADERIQPKTDNEAGRRKKEDQARKARRRSRQLIGVALSILILVGAFSIVRAGITAVNGLMDNSAEKEEFARRISPMVWFDVLPFESVDQLDESDLKQVAIWGVMLEQGSSIERNEEDLAIVPVLEVDLYASRLFGPNFKFTEHSSFKVAAQDLTYQFDEARNAYIVPGTGLEPAYDATVVDIEEADGIKTVIVGYVALRSTEGSIVTTRDYDNPALYMDYVFQRNGNEYYLTALRRNTTYVPPVTASSSVAAASSSASADETSSLPEEDYGTSSAPAETADSAAESASSPA
ncbi:MAG: hypothetical protein ACK5L3_04085 [Oscillospiraceae bacterium]